VARRSLGPGFVIALGCVGAAAQAGAPPDDGLRALAAEAGQRVRVVRIGLEPAPAVRLTSARPFRVVDPATGTAVWHGTFAGPLAFVAEGGPEGPPPVRYRIQVGAFGTREAAETERDRLAAAYRAPAVVAFVPDRGSWRVRVGDAADRDALGPLVERLRADGVRGAWITEEPREIVEAVRLRLVDGRFNGWLSPSGRLVVVPGAAPLEVGGKPYRGIVEIRLTRFGAVRAVNWVESELYLRGVVPAELGPEIWPEVEALKAQAVAARTYLARNTGQFDDDGYDLCGTPSCQVYGGLAAEHPLSDRAVAATAAEILSHDGKPISALYTATCGGHTEDGAEIFPEERAVYLRGVPCRAEGEALDRLKGTVRGATPMVRRDETGDDVTRPWTLLVAAGVLGQRTDASGPPTGTELREWTTALARLTGRPLPSGPAPRIATLGAAALALASETGWVERASVLLSGPDVAAVLRDAAADTLPDAERRALAYLVSAGAIRPLGDGRFGIDAAPTRGRLVQALARIGEAYDAFGLTEATVTSARGGSLGLAQGKGSLTLPLAPRPFLFSSGGERAVPVAELTLWPGDRLRYRVAPDGRVDWMELLPPVKGISDDRSAKVYAWEVRSTRAAVEASLERRVSVGRLRDLRVRRRGVSGRIVELEVVGDRGTAVVKGFDVRRLLGLRESLAVIETQRDAAGEIHSVVFAGKGWGHGVGLCQVGAYGMALRGANYRDILAHYYRGARLETLP
jgi:stage II sporulation protein D